MIHSLTRSMRKQRDTQSGFTLIELLVVIIILGILAAVVVFSVSGINDNGEEAATAIDARTLRTAQEAHFAQHGFYATEEQLVAAGFLSEEPTLNSTEPNSNGPSGDPNSGYDVFVKDGSLVVGVGSDTFNFSGTGGINSNFGMFPYNSNIFETLIRMSPEFTVEPWLATDWYLPGETPPGGGGPLGPMTYRFILRSGVTFHDGSPLTSADVVYSLNSRTSGNAGMRFSTTSAVAVDPSTVDITLTAVNNRLIEQLVHPSIKPIFKNGTVPAASATNVTAMGTGAFKFSSYSQGNELVLSRNDDYWGGADQAYPDPRLQNLTFKFFADSNSRLLALQGGSVDLIYDVPKDSLATVAATSGLKTGVAPPGANEMIWINSHRTDDAGTPGIREDALSDLTVTTPGMPDGQRVRKAIAAAIDRASIIAATYPQGAVLANTMIPAALLSPYAATVTGPTFSVTEAANQLDAAGWTCVGTCGPSNLRTKGGATLTVRLINGYTPTSLRGDSDILVENALEAVGIDVDRQRVGDSAADQTIYNTALANGDRDLYMERIAQNDANPVTAPTSFFDCSGGTYNNTPASGGGNCAAASGLPDYPEAIGPGATFENLIAQARAAATPDEARQKAAEALHEAMDNYVAGVHLASINWLYGMKTDVNGFVLHGSIRHVRWAPTYRSAG